MTDRLGPYLLGPNDDKNNGIYTGDARELAEAIPDESVDLIFTDPVYWEITDYEWLAKLGAHALKDRGDLIVYLAHYHLAEILKVMTEHLTYRWLLVEKKVAGGARIWTYDLICNYIPLLWLTKGKPRDGKRIDFRWHIPEGAEVNHTWSKGAANVIYWLQRFGQEGDIVLDSFCGGGAILAACKMLGRRYLAFEIDPDTAERARERVRNTQPPLFVPEAEQLALEV